LSEALNPATFDVAEMFLGISYPTETVVFYTDHGVAYEMHQVEQELAAAIRREDATAEKAAESRKEELAARGAKSRYVFHLRGQSRDNRAAARNKVLAEYPATHDFLGREVANPDADEMYANLTWSLYIEKVVRPDGAVLVAPDEATVKIIRGNAPDSECAKVEAAIRGFSEGVKDGFELLAQEHDFLSSASPEA